MKLFFCQGILTSHRKTLRKLLGEREKTAVDLAMNVIVGVPFDFAHRAIQAAAIKELKHANHFDTAQPPLERVDELAAKVGQSRAAVINLAAVSKP